MPVLLQELVVLSAILLVQRVQLIVVVELELVTIVTQSGTGHTSAQMLQPMHAS